MSVNPRRVDHGLTSPLSPGEFAWRESTFLSRPSHLLSVCLTSDTRAPTSICPCLATLFSTLSHGHSIELSWPHYPPPFFILHYPTLACSLLYIYAHSFYTPRARPLHISSLLLIQLSVILGLIHPIISFFFIFVIQGQFFFAEDAKNIFSN